MTEKLTRKQVIRALKRLEDGWPDDLWIFAGDGTLHLMNVNQEGDHAYTSNGGVEPDFIVESFGKIDADGGGW